MSQSTFDSLLQKYLAGKCNPEEEKIVLEWYEKLIGESDLHLSASEKNEIEARLWNKIRPAKTRILPLWLKRLVAAVLILLAGSFIYNIWHIDTHNEKNTLAPPVKDMQTLVATKETTKTLADGSVVILQPGAVLTYPDKFDSETKEVHLQGSAFFNIVHDPLKRFLVHAGDHLTTEVLGTSFNIIRHEQTGRIEVQVVTGKVRVFRQATQSLDGIVLTSNKKVVFDSATEAFMTGLVDQPQVVRRQGPQDETDTTTDLRFVFEDETLEQVLSVMSEAYGIRISTESRTLAETHFTGNISAFDLYRQLDIICQSTQSKYEIDGTQIVLRRR